MWAILLLTARLSGCAAAGAPEVGDRIAFRGYLQDFSTTDSEVFFAREFWAERLAGLSAEGFNAIVWTGAHEFSNGEHALVRHLSFPEARELSPEENERVIEQMRWIFGTAHRHGLRNILQTQHVFYTRAFARAHGLEAPMPASSTVALWQARGYPDFWRSDRGRVHHCGVRTELTRDYTRAVYGELLATYPDLDGFYCFNGEAVPGRRSTYFREAVLPAAAASGRSPMLIVSQWQTPVEQFVADIAHEPGGGRTGIWLGYHAYNSEQITDARPYPGVLEWSGATGLPTVVDVYPANQNVLPFNSPRFAHEIAAGLRESGCAGFVYHERFVSGTLLGGLFRRALARYTTGDEPYSEDHWAEGLEARFGSGRAAAHLVRAYDASGRIIPELCALAYSGSDVVRRELRLPYEFFSVERPWSHMTSPARGGRLVPVRHYAQMIALRPDLRATNGSDADRPPYYQEPVWGSEGGSEFDTIPPVHMARVRALGAACSREAAAALRHVRTHEDEARVIADLMEAMRLLAEYYDLKVNASIEAVVYAHSHDAGHRAAAEALADEALVKYVEAATFMHERLDPYYERITGRAMHEAGRELPELIGDEHRDRAAMATLFAWPPPAAGR